MPNQDDQQGDDTERFERQGRQVVIRSVGDRTEIVIDGDVHPVRFLQNGRPMTTAYVNVMARSVRDLAERFVDQMTAEDRHYAEIAKQRAAEAERSDDREESS